MDPLDPFQPPDLYDAEGNIAYPPADEYEIRKLCEKLYLNFCNYENRLIIVKRPDGLFGLVQEDGKYLPSAWMITVDPAHGIENGRVGLNVSFGMPSGSTSSWEESLKKIQTWQFGQNLNWFDRRNWRD